jgi:hypothetical protein
LTRKAFPGMLLVSANEMEGETAFSSNGTAALVGTLSVDGNASRHPADDFLENHSRPATLEGAFVGAVYDPATHRLALVNDKFGKRTGTAIEDAGISI